MLLFYLTCPQKSFEMCHYFTSIVCYDFHISVFYTEIISANIIKLGRNVTLGVLSILYYFGCLEKIKNGCWDSYALIGCCFKNILGNGVMELFTWQQYSIYHHLNVFLLFARKSYIAAMTGFSIAPSLGKYFLIILTSMLNH